MFTGIICRKAAIVQVPPYGESGKVIIAIDAEFLKDAKLGDSVAVDGVCLTMVKIENSSFTVEISPETVEITNFNKISVGKKVNLERPVKLGDSLDGHLVQGHVDTVVKVVNINIIASNKKIILELVDNKYIKYIAEKGSVTLNGVSLTVNQVCNNNFSVNIIPYTLSATNLDDLKIGDDVNLEIDMFSRYCINYLEKSQLTAKI